MLNHSNLWRLSRYVCYENVYLICVFEPRVSLWRKLSSSYFIGICWVIFVRHRGNGWSTFQKRSKVHALSNRIWIRLTQFFTSNNNKNSSRFAFHAPLNVILARMMLQNKLEQQVFFFISFDLPLTAGYFQKQWLWHGACFSFAHLLLTIYWQWFVRFCEQTRALFVFWFK